MAGRRTWTAWWDVVVRHDGKPVRKRRMERDERPDDLRTWTNVSWHVPRRVPAARTDADCSSAADATGWDWCTRDQGVQAWRTKSASQNARRAMDKAPSPVPCAAGRKNNSPEDETRNDETHVDTRNSNLDHVATKPKVWRRSSRVRSWHDSFANEDAPNVPHCSVLFRETTDGANLTAGRTTRLLIHGSLESQRRPDRYEPNTSTSGCRSLRRCDVHD